MTKSFVELVQMARERDRAFAEVPREACLAAARAYAQEQRLEIRKRHDAGESGGNVVALLTEVADTLLQGVFDFALYSVPNPGPLLQRTSLCAQGGYGRAELNPFSDLDIGLIYEGKLDKNIEALNQYLIPFLWDIGYENSYVVRSVKEAVELAKQDTRVFTSYLECRLLYGSSAPYAQLRLSIQGLPSADTAGSFGELKLRERSDSLPAQYSDLYAVEPNLKESAGGLRDYHAALWLFTVGMGTSSVDEAVGQGLISQEENLEIAEALDLIWRIRNELHFQAGRREDRLTLANQRRLAIAFGYTNEAEQDTSRFMEDYYGAARRLRRLLRVAARAGHHASARRLLDTPRAELVEVAEEDGELYVGMGDERWFEENPARLMAVFWECARRSAAHRSPARGIVLSHPAERLVEQSLHLVGKAFQSSDLVRRFFLAICNRPYQAGPALRQAAQTGLLGLYIPEFAAIQGVIRYEDFHHYPVDEHTLRAIEALQAVREMDGPVGAALTTALEHLSDPYILVFALLCHDLGKAQGEEHLEEGVRLVQRIGRRMALPEEDTERVAFLVRHHLLMTHMSMYRDTDDADIVVSFAGTMKTEERLRALFLLSYADLAAVGPDVWSDWKGTLLLKLYLKAEKVLLGRSLSIGEEFWTLPKAGEVRRLLPPAMAGSRRALDQAGGQRTADGAGGLRSADSVEEHLRAFGDRYFVAFDAASIAQHMECLTEADETGLALRCIRNDETNISEVVVCTRDRGGLFSEITGCFASQLVDVRSATLLTRPDGMAMDCFAVIDASLLRPLTDAKFEVVKRTLHKVLMNGQDVEEYLEESRRRLFALLQTSVPVQTRITFDNESSRSHTVLDIESGDRTGLLYEISRAMTACGLDIASARIVTDARRVRDSFYITLNDAKIEDKESQAAIEETLRGALHPRPAIEAKPS